MTTSEQSSSVSESEDSVDSNPIQKPDQQDPEVILNKISPFFKVEKTKYGGRGCYAYTTIPKDTLILACNQSISSTIVRPFKKECCHYCYDYFDGKILKFKISKKFGKDLCSIFFCSEICQQKFIEEDTNEVYQESLLLIEKHALTGSNKPEVEKREPLKDEDLSLLISQEWEDVLKWEKSLQSMKPSKRANMIPRIDDSEYLEIKYVVGVLFQMYKVQTENIQSTNTFLHEVNSSNELKQREIELFDILQSSELEKVLKFPYLIYSYINIYKFIKATSLPELQPFINPQAVREIIGRNLTNAFGIWSETSSTTEDREFFGFGVYPSASYFNHSCDPNLIKKRIKNTLEFVTKRDILPGEEICIDYGRFLDEDVEARRKELKEWFFDCGCEKCNIDLENLKI
ncbi:hypothetical protein DFJ63DRAFT_318049 [Scheffersomyces coipomensis]|uniref:uncharacterized protein n=1 Tax=Scheffersomyces coipomensis TaxID=1788519 RepID=UPI00315DD3B5